MIVTMRTFLKTAYLCVLVAATLAFLGTAGIFAQETKTPATDRVPGRELWRQVWIVRTEYGVPHIRAQNMRAAGYALAWIQCEDYGTNTPMSILSASGRMATVA